MTEAIIVVSIVALAFGTLMAPIQWLADTVKLLLCVGFAVGVPAGIGYHVALSRALRPRNQLPARWWLKPTALHPMLLSNERPVVLRWFYVGGFGFLITAVACVILAGLAFRLFVGAPT